MTTETIRRTAFPAFAGLGAAVAKFIAAMSEGARAAHTWERLNRMSDSQLARHGLTRENIGRAVFERHFG